MVSCKCGEISIDGGVDYLGSSAKNDYKNFLRIDDQGNEQEVTLQEKDSPLSERKPKKASKAECLEMLNEMTKRMEDLPQHAMYAPVTHADQLSLLLLIGSIFEAED